MSHPARHHIKTVQGQNKMRLPEFDGLMHKTCTVSWEPDYPDQLQIARQMIESAMHNHYMSRQAPGQPGVTLGFSLK